MSEGEKNERKAEGKARESECGKAIAEKRVRRSEKRGKRENASEGESERGKANAEAGETGSERRNSERRDSGEKLVRENQAKETAEKQRK